MDMYKAVNNLHGGNLEFFVRNNHNCNFALDQN